MRQREKEVRCVRGRDSADGTHFNKMVMTIVFPVRCADRSVRKKWQFVCDLSVDTSAAEVELQVPRGLRLC